MPYKPASYTDVSPYMMIAGVQSLLDRVVTIFGAEMLRRHEREDGSIMHAEFRIGDSVVMVSEATEAYPPNPCWLHVYVEDVQKTFDHAINAGCTPLQRPEKRDGDPDRRGGVLDPSGICWWISTQEL